MAALSERSSLLFDRLISHLDEIENSLGSQLQAICEKDILEDINKRDNQKLDVNDDSWKTKFVVDIKEIDRVTEKILSMPFPSKYERLF